MKKNYFLGAAAAFGLFALASCSNEDDPISPNQPGEEIATGEQVIVLDMQDTDVLSTKSRPLYSTTNQGAELVTDVKLLVFKHSKTDGEAMTLDNVLTINKWDQNSSDYNYGRKYTLKLEGTDKLDKDESYTILAVGQDESNTSATTFAPYQIVADAESWISELTKNSWTTKTWNAGSDNGQGFLKTVARTGNEAEIFSGISKPVTLNFDGGFTAEVLLKRQVAGVLGYFTKIPAFVLKSSEDGDVAADYDAVKQIRLVASNKNTQIDLAHALGNQKDDATEVGKENVVNGFTPETTKDANFNGGTSNAFVVYTIDLSKWFKKNADANDVETMKQDLLKALISLRLDPKVIDKTLLLEKIEEVKSLNKDLYLHDSYKQLLISLEQALVVYENQQATLLEVEQAIDLLNQSLLSLEYKPADYTKVDEAIEKANQLNKEDYKDFHLVEKAISLVDRNMNITEQDKVDLMAKAIEYAIACLEKKDIPQDEDILEDSTNQPSIDVKPIEPGDNTQNNDAIVPQTGDMTSTGVYTLLIVLSSCLLFVLKRKQS